MSLVDYVRRIFTSDEEPLRHNHRYVDNLTGEAFVIESIGTRATLRRQDARHRHKTSADPDLLREALSRGIIEHDDEECQCVEKKNVSKG